MEWFQISLPNGRVTLIDFSKVMQVVELKSEQSKLIFSTASSSDGAEPKVHSVVVDHSIDDLRRMLRKKFLRRILRA